MPVAESEADSPSNADGNERPIMPTLYFKRDKDITRPNPRRIPSSDSLVALEALSNYVPKHETETETENPKPFHHVLPSLRGNWSVQSGHQIISEIEWFQHFEERQGMHLQESANAQQVSQRKVDLILCHGIPMLCQAEFEKSLNSKPDTVKKIAEKLYMLMLCGPAARQVNAIPLIIKWLTDYKESLKSAVAALLPTYPDIMEAKCSRDENIQCALIADSEVIDRITTAMQPNFSNPEAVRAFTRKCLIKFFNAP